MTTVTVNGQGIIDGPYQWVLWRFASPSTNVIPTEVYNNILALSLFAGNIQSEGLQSSDPLDQELGNFTIPKWWDTSDPVHVNGDTATFTFYSDNNVDPEVGAARAIARATRFVDRANAVKPGSAEKLDGPNLRIKYIPGTATPIDPPPPPPVDPDPDPDPEVPSVFELNKATKLRAESLVKELSDVVRLLQSSVNVKLTPTEASSLNARIAEINTALLSPGTGGYYGVIVNNG